MQSTPTPHFAAPETTQVPTQTGGRGHGATRSMGGIFRPPSVPPSGPYGRADVPGNKPSVNLNYPAWPTDRFFFRGRFHDGWHSAGSIACVSAAGWPSSSNSHPAIRRAPSQSRQLWRSHRLECFRLNSPCGVRTGRLLRARQLWPTELPSIQPRQLIRQIYSASSSLWSIANVINYIPETYFSIIIIIMVGPAFSP